MTPPSADVSPEARTSLVDALADAVAAGHLGGTTPVEAHLDHAIALGVVIAASPGERWIDLGTGAGVPGLVLATMYPAARWVLLDRSETRVGFVQRQIIRLGLSNATAACADATDLGRRAESRGSFDGVVARSFGRPGVLAECAAPLLRSGGRLVVSEPPDRGAADASGGRWPVAGCALVGLSVTERRSGPPAVAVLARTGPCPERFPRRWAALARSPLF